MREVRVRWSVVTVLVVSLAPIPMTPTPVTVSRANTSIVSFWVGGCSVWSVF